VMSVFCRSNVKHKSELDVVSDEFSFALIFSALLDGFHAELQFREKVKYQVTF